jgi:hypothetical protein
MDTQIAPPPDPTQEPGSGRRSRLGAALGVASALLLVASFIWAHHWGPLADTIVLAWLLAWPSAMIVSGLALSKKDAGRNLARVGLVLSIISLVILLTVGVAVAFGADPSSLCGGG